MESAGKVQVLAEAVTSYDHFFFYSNHQNKKKNERKLESNDLDVELSSLGRAVKLGHL